ncbi:MAG: Hsp20 family protein [Parvularculaceae bacterium]
MRNFDFSPFYRSTVGFDRIFDLMDSASKVEQATSGYPPYNIERTGEDSYRISIAVAGFSADDIDIELHENTLKITGERPAEENERTYLHQGIAGRSFERRFQLADHVRVDKASLENGLLNIDLVREVPETMKPRKIEINSKSGKILKGPQAA